MEEENNGESKNITTELTDINRVLIKKRDSLLLELSNLETNINNIKREYNSRIAELEEKENTVKTALKHVEALLTLEGWKESQKTVNDVPSKKNQESEKYIDIAYNILQSNGEPMHYKDIFVKTKEKGASIPGKNPAATLLVKMSRDLRFKRIKKRGTYALSIWKISGAKSRSRRVRKKNRRE